MIIRSYYGRSPIVAPRLFDDFTTHKGDARDLSVPRFSGTIDMAIVSNELVTTGSTRGGIVLDTPRGLCPPMPRIATRSVGSESRTDNFTGGTYRIQAVVDRNGGDADIWFHYTDPNNAYRVRYDTANERNAKSSCRFLTRTGSRKKGLDALHLSAC